MTHLYFTAFLCIAWTLMLASCDDERWGWFT